MVNPKTGKKQLSDYEHKGPRRRIVSTNILNEEISSLPNKEDVVEKQEGFDDQRSELNGVLKHRR